MADDPKIRVAIVGSGPAGFYAAEPPAALRRRRGRPVRPPADPVGARARRRRARPSEDQVGHARVREDGGKPRASASTATSRSARDVTHDELLEHHHAVLYAFGAANDRRLGIPGEDLPGSHAATEFVAWYNGHPDYADHEFDLSAQRAVVIGNGNVALDVARMLALTARGAAPHRHRRPRDRGARPRAASRRSSCSAAAGPRRPPTPTPSSASSARWRTPTSSSTPPTSSSTPASARLRSRPSEADRTSRATWRSSATSPRARRTAKASGSSCASCLAGRDPRRGPVDGVRVVRNELIADDGGGCAPRATGDEESSTARSCCARSATAAPASRASRSTSARGTILNDDGRVLDRGRRAAARRLHRGLDQARAVRRHRHEQEVRPGDRRAPARATSTPGRFPSRRTAPPSSTRCSRSARRDVVDYAGWERIDEHERAAASPGPPPRQAHPPRGAARARPRRALRRAGLVVSPRARGSRR